jgi:hypothetical protein
VFEWGESSSSIWATLGGLVLEEEEGDWRTEGGCALFLDEVEAVV